MSTPHELQGIDALRAACPPGTTLVGPADANGGVLAINGVTAAACMKPDGTRHGRAMTWYENGSPASEGEYRDGLKEGEWLFWHPNGQLSGRGSFHLDKPEGLWTTWHDNGRKATEIRYEQGVASADVRCWNREGEAS
jgi:antitoxin component YwqK of YwqJK toxin-antitoxin module